MNTNFLDSIYKTNMKPELERVQNLLKDTVTTLCRNSLLYQHGMKVQGLLGITLDDNDVFIVHINEMFQNIGAESVTIQKADSVTRGLDDKTLRASDAFAQSKLLQAGIIQPPPTLTPSPTSRSVSRRKARPWRAVGGLSDPKGGYEHKKPRTDGYRIISPDINVNDMVKEELDEEESFSISADDSDKADQLDGDVDLMKQSYMTGDEFGGGTHRIDLSQDDSAPELLATSSTSDAKLPVIPQTINLTVPYSHQGGPFISGVAHNISDNVDNNEVPGNFTVEARQGTVGHLSDDAIGDSEEDWNAQYASSVLLDRGPARSVRKPNQRMSWSQLTGASSKQAPINIEPLDQEEAEDLTLELKSQDITGIDAYDSTPELKSPNTLPRRNKPYVSRTPRGIQAARRRLSGHANNKLFSCKVCNKTYWSRNTLVRHEKVHDPKLFHCKKCTLFFQTQERLIQHDHIKHGQSRSGKYQCLTCNRKFRNSSHYYSHMSSIHGVTNIETL